MKKTFSILVCAAALLTLSACGGAGGTADAEGAGNSGNVQMPNPLVLSSLEEIEELDGVSITLPDGADSVTAIRISTDPVVDSVTFDVDGLRYVYRVARAGTLTDISGMYYEWGEPEGGDVPDGAPRCLISDEGQGLFLWYRDGHTFNLAMTEGAESGIISEMYHKLDGGTSVTG